MARITSAPRPTAWRRRAVWRSGGAPAPPPRRGGGRTARPRGARSHSCGLVTLVEERQQLLPVGLGKRPVCPSDRTFRGTHAVCRVVAPARGRQAARRRSRDGGEDRRRADRGAWTPPPRGRPSPAPRPRRRRRAARARPLPARAPDRLGRLRRRVARRGRAPRARRGGQAHRDARRRGGARAPSARRARRRACRTPGSSPSTSPAATTRPSTWSPSSCAGARWPSSCATASCPTATCCASASRCATRWPTPTAAASSTATSSRATSSCPTGRTTARASPSSPTSASRA